MTTVFYVVADNNGLPTGFYTSDIFPLAKNGSANANLPTGAIAVSQDDWNSLMQNSAIIVDGAAQACTPPAPIVTPDVIDAERDRRLYGGFLFNGVPYQSDEVSIANILGSAQLAFMAIVAGAQAGNYEWTGASTPFLYIAADNSKQQMDAQTVVNFAKAAAAFRSTIIYMGRAAKDALAAGQTVDVTADATWGMDSTSPISTAKAAPAASSTTAATTPASGTSGAPAASQTPSS